MTAWWPFSPLWGLVPIVLFFIYGLMKANYEAFRRVEAERDEERTAKEALEKKLATDKQRANLKVLLTKAWQEGQLLHDNYASEVDAAEWGHRVSNLIYNALNQSEAQRLYSDTGLQPIAPGNDTPTRQWIRWRQARIENLIERLDRDHLNPKPVNSEFDPEIDCD